MLRLMMKTNYKNLLAKFWTILILLTFIIPAFVLAQSQNKNNSQSKICTAIVKFAERLDQRFVNQEAKLTARRLERVSKIANHQVEVDVKIDANREKWDDNREEQFGKLEEKAQTDAQKQAVAQFKSTMTAAISTRRAAVDVAIQTFRQGLQQAINDRKTATDTTVSTYKSTINLAIDKAKSDCASGVDTKTVRTNLIQSLKTAREQFNTARQNIEKLSESVETLVAARKQAVEKAHDDFKKAAEQARIQLKAAFGQASPSPSVSPTSTPSPTT